jgi:hypothetical protein
MKRRVKIIVLLLGLCLVPHFPAKSDAVLLLKKESEREASRKKTICALLADRLMFAIIKGGRNFKSGDKEELKKEDVVWFAYNSKNKKGLREFFLLPKDPEKATGPSDIVWFPQPNNDFPIKYKDAVVQAHVAKNFAGFKGYLRKIDAAIVKELVFKKFPAKSGITAKSFESLSYCFSVTRAQDKQASKKQKKEIYFRNLFHITFYVFFEGSEKAVKDSSNKVHILKDPKTPDGPQNKKIDHFDFLVNINKS